MSVADRLFRGLSAFPITPADARGRVDGEALGRVLRPLAAAGVDSIGLLGSTGAYAYLTRAERRRAIEAAADCVGGQVKLIVGIGALRTDDAQDLARDAEAAGAAGLLLAPVSYTPLTEEEVFQHFVSVAGVTGLPLCIYNNPTTTHFSFSDGLVERLAKVPGIVAIKAGAPPPAEVRERHRALRARVPEAFAIGYAVDWHAGDALLAGADAWFSVVAGLLPGPSLGLLRAALAGDAAEVARWNTRFQPLWELFRELSSLRVMYAGAEILGLCRVEPPRPILPLGRADFPRVAAVLERVGSGKQ